MLNGIDPILIFQFSKAIKKPGASKIPVASSILSQLPLPAIPIYLSELLTGIYIDTEEKNIDIDTSIETNLDDKPEYNQRSITSTVKITMLASSDSIGLTLLSAMTQLIFPIVTSREYSITYIHGPIVILQGFLHAFSISQDTGTSLYRINLELIDPGLPAKTPQPKVPNSASGVVLDPSKVPGA